MENVTVSWIARTFAIGLSLFLALFALDELEPGKPLGRTVVDVLIHLWPTVLVLIVVALSWRRQWIGAVAFVALAVAYAVTTRFRIDWVLVISGPLFTIGLLYLWSWKHAQTAS
jgi:hypothetical protein